MKKTFLIVILSLIYLTQISAQVLTLDSRAEFTVQNISGWVFELGEGIDSILERWGENQAIELVYQNSANSAFDIFVWKVFGGVEAYFYRGDRRISRVVIRNPVYTLKENGFGVQSSITDILEFYGTPDSDYFIGSERHVVYRVPESQVMQTSPSATGFLQDYFQVKFVVNEGTALIDGSSLVTRMELNIETPN